MPVPNTLKQPIYFGDLKCGGNSQPLIISNIESCPGIPNANFQGNPVTDWTATAGITQVGSNPCRITASNGTTHSYVQDGITLEEGNFQPSYSIENNDTGTMQVLLQINNLSTGFTKNYSQSIVGAGLLTFSTDDLSIPNGSNDDFRVIIAIFQSGGTQLDATINYVNFCPLNASSLDFCFQLPMFEEGDELLELAEVDLDEAFNDTNSYTRQPNLSSVACGVPISDRENHFVGSPPTVTNSPAADGQHFLEYTFGTISIDYSENYETDALQQVAITGRNAGLSRTSENTFVVDADANTSMLMLDDNVWTTSDDVDVWYRAKYSCDGEDERVQFEINLTGFRMIPNFYEETFTGESDSFYRLKFDLSKTSSVLVEVKDSNGTTIFEATETGATFDKIFKTGTLPTTTVTVRFEVFTLDEFPSANFNSSVLQNISLYKMCKWDVEAQETDGTTVAALTEVHATESESLYTLSYNRNVLYCFNTQNVSSGCYMFEASNSCDSNEKWLSNKVQVCDGNCNVKKVTWDHDGYKYMGDYVLDYTNYDYETFFFARIDFQDLAQQFDGVYYRDSLRSLRNPYTSFSSVQTMQVFPLPAFMRDALSVALTSDFYVDSDRYRKVDDEEVTPQFSAVGNSPVRILVQKVGDNVVSRNS